VHDSAGAVIENCPSRITVYPTLSDLINDLFGIYIPLPFQTFGFFLAFSFACAAFTLYHELIRKERQGLLPDVTITERKGFPATAGELITSAVLGFLLGFKAVYIFNNYAEFVADTQGVLLSSKGSPAGGIAGAVIFVWLKYRERSRNRLAEPTVIHHKGKPHQLLGNFTMIGAIAGLLGAKIFHNLENPQEFETDPLDALIAFSGLTMYGALICGGAALLIYSYRKGIAPLHFADAISPGMMLAYGTGRIGCHLAGDGDWGIVNMHMKPAGLSWLPDWAWAYNYPRNVINEGIPIPGCTGNHCSMLPDAVYPTPLYEAVICIILFIFLWSVRKKLKYAGQMFFIYLLLNGIERFFIEKIRVNTKYHIAGYAITQAEIISSLLIIAGVTGFIYITGKQRRNEHRS
jgi:phosphatidylglycerol---prolipoprotein diacylglyceryl transferase